MAQCRATTRTGAHCQRSVEGPHGYCWGHAPENAAQRSRQASRAGRAKPNKELATIKHEVRAVIDGVLGGRFDKGVASVALQGYSILLRATELQKKVFEVDELAAEIQELKREYGNAS